MEKIDKKKLYEAVDLAENACVVLSDKAFSITANNGEALTLLSMMVDELKNRIGIPEEIIINSVKIGLMTSEEKMDKVIEIFKKQFGGE